MKQAKTHLCSTLLLLGPGPCPGQGQYPGPGQCPGPGQYPGVYLSKLTTIL